jgi:signal transduction histidine kinase
MRGQSSTTSKKPICPSRYDLASVIAAVVEEYTEKFKRRGITLELDVPHDVAAVIDGVLMRDAFRKLIDNAVEAMPQGGDLVITSLTTPQHLVIEFADSGPGISDELRHRLFEPFATTKHDHAGLGLCMVRDIVGAHHGTVTVMECPEGGTAFTIQLPQAREQRMAA